MNMPRKPQQQTLSIRIPDALRDFLEQSQRIICNGGGESVSISEVAKTLLESRLVKILVRDGRCSTATMLIHHAELQLARLLAVRPKPEQPVNQKPAMMDGSHERQSMGSSAGVCHGAGQSGTASAERIPRCGEPYSPRTTAGTAAPVGSGALHAG